MNENAIARYRFLAKNAPNKKIKKAYLALAQEEREKN